MPQSSIVKELPDIYHLQSDGQTVISGTAIELARYFFTEWHNKPAGTTYISVKDLWFGVGIGLSGEVIFWFSPNSLIDLTLHGELNCEISKEMTRLHNALAAFA
jgi:hypothetical protein